MKKVQNKELEADQMILLKGYFTTKLKCHYLLLPNLYDFLSLQNAKKDILKNGTAVFHFFVNGYHCCCSVTFFKISSFLI